jgi:hypothetical protein
VVWIWVVGWGRIVRVSVVERVLFLGFLALEIAGREGWALGVEASKLASVVGLNMVL